MDVLIASFVVLILVAVAMAVGVMVGRRPLRPSCGGDAVVHRCPVCTEESPS